MSNVLWCLAFLLDVVVFIIAGTIVALWTLLKGTIKLLLGILEGAIAEDLLYSKKCIKTLGELWTAFPKEVVRILKDRIKKSYDTPFIFSVKRKGETDGQRSKENEATNSSTGSDDKKCDS